uniref:Uncharacterized protein n=1 Tax=Romanomermis culicivorax TaxID=13658 RepID=A0A915ITK5_ROMCU
MSEKTAIKSYKPKDQKVEKAREISCCRMNLVITILTQRKKGVDWYMIYTHSTETVDYRSFLLPIVNYH